MPDKDGQIRGIAVPRVPWHETSGDGRQTRVSEDGHGQNSSPVIRPWFWDDWDGRVEAAKWLQQRADEKRSDQTPSQGSTQTS